MKGLTTAAIPRIALSAALAAFGLALAVPSVRPQDGGIAVGARPPAAAVQTLDGKPVALASLVGSGPAVVEFWATWCPNCKELETTLAAAEKKYAGHVR